MFSNLRIVLVNTKNSGNIGAAARAMKNMAINNLYLVQPQKFPHDQAIWRAAHAQDLLDNAHVCDDLPTAIEQCHTVIGTSARSRNLSIPLLSPHQCAQKIINSPPQHKIAILFGREDCGLSNDEIQQCHAHVFIPTHENYTSLNLAAAVQVICYEIYNSFLESSNNNLSMNNIDENQDIESDIATQEEVNYFLDHLKETLLELQFYDPKSSKQLLHRLRRMFMRCRLEKIETRILRGILSAVQKVIPKKYP